MKFVERLVNKAAEYRRRAGIATDENSKWPLIALAEELELQATEGTEKAPT